MRYPGPRNASSLRQNGPCLAVLTDANMPASDGSPRAERQPEPSKRLSPAADGESGCKMGDRASIPRKMAEVEIKCNSFASASTYHENGTESRPCKVLRKCFTLWHDQITR